MTLSGRTWLSDSCAGFLDSEPARHLPHRAFLACLLVCSACLTPLSARMTARVGPCTPIVAGLLFLLAGAVALAAVPTRTPVWTLALLLVPVGLSGPLVMPPTTRGDAL